MSLDQRKFRRAEGNVLVDIEPVGTFDTLEAKTLDISEGGLKIMLKEPVEVDRTVMVSCTMPMGVSEEFFLESRATVKWCRSEGNGDYEIGVEFMEMTHEDRENLSNYIARNTSGW